MPIRARRGSTTGDKNRSRATLLNGFRCEEQPKPVFPLEDSILKCLQWQADLVSTRLLRQRQIFSFLCFPAAAPAVAHFLFTAPVFLCTPLPGLMSPRDCSVFSLRLLRRGLFRTFFLSPCVRGFYADTTPPWLPYGLAEAHRPQRVNFTYLTENRLTSLGSVMVYQHCQRELLSGMTSGVEHRDKDVFINMFFCTCRAPPKVSCCSSYHVEFKAWTRGAPSIGFL